MKGKATFTLKVPSVIVIGVLTLQFTLLNPPALKVEKGSHIVLIGNNLGSRMLNYGHFETEMHLRYPDSLLYIRNMSDGGNTPGFRPHAGRASPWAFSGAEKFQTELARSSGSEGHFETEDEWLTRLKADIIIAFFGYNESFQGPEGLENYKAELDAFIKHTLSQNYNGDSSTQLAIVSPIAFEDLAERYDLPNGEQENVNLKLYAEAMQEVAAKNNVHFVDAYTPTKKWFDASKEPLTIDGSQLTDAGYERFSKLLADKVFGKATPKAEAHRALVRAAVLEKNWMWHNDFKIPNGVHVFGRRYNPFGPDNYPAELAKIREMTAIRDEAIRRAAKGEKMDVAAADQKTTKLPPVETNYDPEENGSTEYLYGQDALDKLHVAPGYKIELFASEKEFADLANPVQLSFDNKGRLWVATMPSYPHYKPGDARPNDKLIILEDTNKDGKADKQTTFADSLHLPVGFELAPEGVYVSQGTNLMLYTDTDGDDKADKKEILLSGFDDHDTHHAHGAYTADPSGAIYMGEGVFLHTNVETSYGPVRGTNGGFYRYNPQRRQLERTAQLSIPNPWGIAFDEWGENFFAETSSPDVRWMMPGTVKPRYGVATHKSVQLIEDKHLVRPTSGLEFVSSRHFPNEVQGDMLINNTIGYLGMKQHMMVDDGTGYKSKHRQDLVQGDDRNFRPVDMEFAPDGSLYLVDWHNVLIGHMQHNARDPLRDHVHGRIYRITYPSRPLVAPAKVAGASINELLDNLKLPEFRTRYRTRRELRGRKAPEVLPQLRTWTANLDKNDARYEHHLLEALWVSWGLNQVDETLLRKLLKAKDYRARAAAIRVLRYTGHQVADQADLLMEAARDEHGRVRLEAIVAASWLGKDEGLPIVMEAGKKPLDEWMVHAHETALAHLSGREVEEKKEVLAKTDLKGAERDLFIKGEAIYAREGFCGTCHQPDAKGLSASGFPPLTGTKWVSGSDERLIKLVLNGLHGPIKVLGKEYPGQVPMTPFGGMLKDEEVAAVLTYVRNSFGNKASAISPDKVRQVREATKNKTGFYSPEELLKQHPMEE
ncbi:putative membrane-bound dehydrogenase-like protein [Pontibacter ummariensis]|uniref:Putative membrane-bound dehydrogenase domain-containing protein n=2 Tax=Pontibacter ummariensis TaxID=1610492 RepID=A0A239LQR5_9BACT|nr:putative membrane-bound dehydrogenase-like protein [Pontibacter ummariensis]SNT32242.1 putative membrane-bound dehydrogenase domain-containing protein [Pontibacter ummariensis]